MFIANGTVEQIEPVPDPEAPIDARAARTGEAPPAPMVLVHILMKAPHAGTITLKAPADMGGLALGNCRVMIDAA